MPVFDAGFELDAEERSVARMALDACGQALGAEVFAYFKSVPENFRVPSIYFPMPQRDVMPGTTEGYRVRHTWAMDFRHMDGPAVYAMATAALTRFASARYTVRLLDAGGAPTGKVFYLLDVTDRRGDGPPASRLVVARWDGYRDFERPPQKPWARATVIAQSKGAV